jgi:predicted molibdopterin-dependent oxidoreductase YjgC
MDQSLIKEDAVAIDVDGNTIIARPGDSVAVALHVVGVSTLRHSPRSGAPRGIFCLMGSCQECLVMIDNKRRLACETIVRAGMSIRTGGQL